MASLKDAQAAAERLKQLIGDEPGVLEIDISPIVIDDDIDGSDGPWCIAVSFEDPTNADQLLKAAHINVPIKRIDVVYLAIRHSQNIRHLIVLTPETIEGKRALAMLNKFYGRKQQVKAFSMVDLTFPHARDNADWRIKLAYMLLRGREIDWPED